MPATPRPGLWPVQPPTGAASALDPPDAGTPLAQVLARYGACPGASTATPASEPALHHQAAAANRADIRRLVALTQAQAESQGKVEALQSRLAELRQSRDQQVGQLQAQVAALQQALAQQNERTQQALNALQALQASAAPAALARTHRDQARQLARQLPLLEASQVQRGHEAAAQRDQLQDVQGRLDRATGLISGLHAELQALEAELAGSGTDATRLGLPISPLQRGLQGQRLLYVGGRPASVQAIRQLVERAGGQWLHHDGGLEDRKGLLAASVPRADRVVFPVDCIDHDSMQRLKRLCMRHGVAYLPLRSASVASFVAALGVPDTPVPLANGAALASRFCLRHG